MDDTQSGEKTHERTEEEQMLVSARDSENQKHTIFNVKTATDFLQTSNNQILDTKRSSS